MEIEVPYLNGKGHSGTKKGPDGKMTLSEYVDYFFELKRNSLRETTLERIYRPSFKALLSLCGNKPLSSYTVADVEVFKSERLRNCAPTTVNIEFRTLRAAFNFAVEIGLIERSPFSKSSLIRIPEQLPIYISQQEFPRFCAQIDDPELKDLFYFAVMTGMRQGEILNLKWSEIDLERKLIVVSSGAGFLTKTGKTRTLPMNDTVFDILSRKAGMAPTCPFVFHRKNCQFKASYVTHQFKKCMRAAHLNDKLKFHSLRHTFATWLVRNGCSIYEVQKLLGHSDVKTTQMYAHLLASELHSTVNKINLTIN
jgi:integrase